MFIKNTGRVSKSWISSESSAIRETNILRCFSHCGLRRLSTVTLFGASFFFRNYFRHCLFLLLLKPQTMPKKRRQASSKKPSSKKPYKRPPSGEERNTKSTFLEGVITRVLNDKAARNNNKMAYGYYPKLLKEYGSAFQ